MVRYSSRLKSTGDGGIEIIHREFIQDIIAPAPGYTQSYAFQIWPLEYGLAHLPKFPWLDQIARSFQQWKPMELAVEYRTTCGQVVQGVNNSLGSVSMCVDYDANVDPIVGTGGNARQKMSNVLGNTTGPPFRDQIHYLDCSPKNWAVKLFYVAESNTKFFDKRFSSLGQFSLIVDGTPSANKIGELWFSYRIRFYKPTFQNDLTSTLSVWDTTGAASNVAPFYLMVARPGNVFYAVTINQAAVRFTGYTGRIVMDYNVAGSVTAGLTLQTFVPTCSNPDATSWSATQVLYWNSKSISVNWPAVQQANTYTAQGYTYSVCFDIAVNAGDFLYITPTGGVFPTAISNGTLIVRTVF